MVGGLWVAFEVLHADVALLKQVVVLQPQHGIVDLAGEESSILGRLKVLEPTKFERVRSVKDLENFICDMQEYFVVANILEEHQVSMANMFLMGDAKLWYRTHTEENESADCSHMEI